MQPQVKKKRRTHDKDNGFGEWGGYMNAKISKLEAQFEEDQVSAVKKDEKASDIFKGVSIFVNGFTEPSADELRCIMLQNGGIYHHYFRAGKTTHIIASALPNAKFGQLNHFKIVKSEWITESLKSGKLLDYKKFLLLNDFPNNFKRGNDLLEFCKKEGLIDQKEEAPKTAADEGYLAEFYNNSRLHYISALGAMLKQHVQDLREKSKGVFLGRLHLIKQHASQIKNSIESENFIDENLIIHIDMDCFFVSVALRNHPHLKGQPVAVTHARGNFVNFNSESEVKFGRKKTDLNMQQDKDSSSNSDEDKQKEKSSKSEIASCSYEARKYGVQKGMYLGVAQKLCPNLKTVPYDFKGYKEVALILYNTVAEYTLDIEAISCDELVIDYSSLYREVKIDPLNFSQILRQEILEKTNCTASVGIGANKLLAKLAIIHAKPNGQFHLTPEKVDAFMEKLPIRDLPGVGRTLNTKLQTLSIKTCGDLQQLPLSVLKKEFGNKTGEMLHKYCRGIDDRKVNFSHERKSISAEINYGIRFNDDLEVDTFLKQLSEEVSKRLKDIKMIGKTFTLKIMFRAKDAPVETSKFLGHGICDQINRSVNIPFATSDTGVISKHVINLYHQSRIPPNELRGIGIHINKLEPFKKTLKSVQNYFENATNKCEKIDQSYLKQPSVKQTLPQIPEINPEVLASLPNDIRSEILKEYGLKIVDKEIQKTNSSPDKKLVEDKSNAMVSCAVEEKAYNFLNLTLNEMRILIKEWVTAEKDPQIYDMNMLEYYLHTLVEKRRLEDLNIIMKCLHRHIKNLQKDSEIWKTTYNNLVAKMQQSMMAVYKKLYACETID